MTDLKIDTKLLPKLVNEKFDLVKLLYNYNPDGHYSVGEKCFCPFHHNENDEAAVIYAGKDGQPDSLYCFSQCKRQYTAKDVISRLQKQNVLEVGYAIWNSMADYERQTFLNKHGHIDYAKAFSLHRQPTITNQQVLVSEVQYKEGTITLDQLLLTYKNSL